MHFEIGLLLDFGGEQVIVVINVVEQRVRVASYIPHCDR